MSIKTNALRSGIFKSLLSSNHSTGLKSQNEYNTMQTPIAHLQHSLTLKTESHALLQFESRLLLFHYYLPAPALRLHRNLTKRKFRNEQRYG